MSESSWHTTGGGLDGVDGVITEFWFGTNANYQSGTRLLGNAKVVTDDGSESEVSWPCGDGWESIDGGKTAQREDKSQKRVFHKASWMGRFIDRLVGPSKTKDGKPAPGLDMAEVLQSRGEAYEAKSFEGLKFSFAEQEFDFGKNKETGERITASRTMPVAFLGVVSEGEQAKAKANAPAAETAAEPTAQEKAAAAKAKAAAAKNGGGLRDQLIELAKQHETHGAFVDAALAVEGVTDDDDLLAAVVEESALYAEARA